MGYREPGDRKPHNGPHAHTQDPLPADSEPETLADIVSHKVSDHFNVEFKPLTLLRDENAELRTVVDTTLERIETLQRKQELERSEIRSALLRLNSSSLSAAEKVERNLKPALAILDSVQGKLSNAEERSLVLMSSIEGISNQNSRFFVYRPNVLKPCSCLCPAKCWDAYLNTLTNEDSADPADAVCTCICQHNLPPPPPLPLFTEEDQRNFFAAQFRSHDWEMASRVEKAVIKAMSPGMALQLPVPAPVRPSTELVPFVRSLGDSYKALNELGLPIIASVPLAALWAISNAITGSYTPFPTIAAAAQSFGVFGFSTTQNPSNATFRLPGGLATWTLPREALPVWMRIMKRSSIDFASLAMRVFELLIAPRSELLARMLMPKDTPLQRLLSGPAREQVDSVSSLRCLAAHLSEDDCTHSVVYYSMCEHLNIGSCPHDGRFRSCPKQDKCLSWCHAHVSPFKELPNELVGVYPVPTPHITR